MNINEEYAMELLLAYHSRGSEIGGGYGTCFMYECQITNPERLDKWLLNNGYLRKPTIKETLSRYKVPELKGFLSQKRMKVTGKKAELIERLVSVLSENDIDTLMKSDKRYFLSEKGTEHYRENIDLYELHRNWKYRLQLNEYFKYRKSNGVVRDFYEIAYLALKEKLEKGNMDIRNPYRLNRFDFESFSEVCEKLDMNEDAIKSTLMKLYFETNLIDSALFPFEEHRIRVDGVENICDRLQENSLFNPYTTQRIVSLSEFYSEYMVDDIYDKIKLQYVVFERNNFKSAIDDMIRSAYFDTLPYMKIIKDNYREVATHIMKDKNAVSFSRILKFLKGK